MSYRLAVTFLFLGLASLQAIAAILRPPVLTSSPSVLPLPYNPVVEVLPPIVDVQARTALSCGCGQVSCGCSSATVDCRIPTSVSPIIAPTCGCGVPSCGCAVPTCGCGMPTAAYRAPVGYPTIDAGYYSAPTCGCVPAALTTPLLPPFPPVVGCTKYLRQVCVQPPFL